MYISEDIKYIGVKDDKKDLFEGQYAVPEGIAYNSYVILDEKIAVMDTVDTDFTEEWLDSLQVVLNGLKPDYLVVHHMEPDHSASIAVFLMRYPETVVVASSKAFSMMKNFFGNDYAERRVVVGDGDVLCLGKHMLHFATAMMVHWPEVMMRQTRCYFRQMLSVSLEQWRQRQAVLRGAIWLVQKDRQARTVRQSKMTG